MFQATNQTGILQGESTKADLLECIVTNGYKWWVFGIYLNSLEGNRISCCVWVTYQNYPKISKVVCKPNSGVLELCFKTFPTN